MTKTVTKDQYKQAIVNSTILQPFEFYLSKLDADTISDDVEVQQKITEIKTIISDIYSQHKAVIERGQEQICEQDTSIVNHVLSRLHKIGEKLKRNLTELERMRNAYEQRSKESMEKQIPMATHKPFTNLPTSEDEDRIANNRRKLEEERSRLNEFIKTAPFFEYELLQGTGVEMFLEKPETA
jgi:predicted transcriptional regulator